MASAGCLTVPAAPMPTGPEMPAPPGPEMLVPPVQAFQAGVELPAGQGRDVLVSACLGCHELTALELFRGFYTRDSWRSLIVTMRANGAQVDDADVEMIADYLAEHFGQGSP